MATTLTISSNYVGKEAGAIIGKTFKEADTIARKLVTVLQNVNYKAHLEKIQYTDGTTAYSCGHTPAGAIALTEKTVEPVKLKNDMSFCKETFRQTWHEDLMGQSASNPNAPQNIIEAIQAEVLATTAQRTDNIIWVGDSANSDEWDGFLTLFANDGNVIKANNGIVPSGNAITKDTVIDEFDTVTKALPYRLRRKNVAMLVSPDVADAYSKYLIENGAANGLGGNANTGLVYGRYSLEVVNGLPDNTIVMYEVKNLVFATGLLGDHNQLSFNDEDEIGLLTGNIRGKMVYNAGCGYYNSEDIVWYLSTTTPA